MDQKVVSPCCAMAVITWMSSSASMQLLGLEHDDGSLGPMTVTWVSSGTPYVWSYRARSAGA
jgi:hypothetical protein